MTLRNWETAPTCHASYARASQTADAARHASTRVVVVPHPGVDGLAAGVLALRALEAEGARGIARVPDKGEHAFSPATQERLRAMMPDAVVVLERGTPTAPRQAPSDGTPQDADAYGQVVHSDASTTGLRVPCLVVAPRALAEDIPGATLRSAHGLTPAVTCSLLTYVLVSPFVAPGPLEWLAALGTVADQGVDAPIPFLKDALRRAGRTAVTESVSLLNAARRSSRFAVPLALEVLLRAGRATDITRGNVPGVDVLHDCRMEVQREVVRCSKTPPRIANDVALLLFSSDAQVHSQVAVRWAQRLPEHIVIAANAGYLPGRVDYAVRSRVPIDLDASFTRLGIRAGALGGSLPQTDFLQFAASLGFKGLRGIDVERRGAFPG